MSSTTLILILVASVSSGGGLFAGWLLFRNERTYNQGWNDRGKHERLREFQKQVNERERRRNADDWYDK